MVGSESYGLIDGVENRLSGAFVVRIHGRTTVGETFFVYVRRETRVVTELTDVHTPELGVFLNENGVMSVYVTPAVGAFHGERTRQRPKTLRGKESLKSVIVLRKFARG